MTIRSLRGRLLLSSVLWTSGLLFLVSFALVYVIRHHPRTRLAYHVHAFVEAPFVIVVAVGCLVLGLVHARRGLASVDRLRTQLAALNAGRERRMAGTYPAEVQPLVDDLNGLLDHRERAIERALARAGDLAHGLKTPLAVLGQEAASARSAGQAEIADAIDEQVARMHRHVNYHLAQARAAASGASSGARASVKASVEGLMRALARVYAERGLSVESSVDSDRDVRIQREDLDEMIGNLFDNACKWARSRVVVDVRSRGDRVIVTVEDDGEGLPEAMREAVLRRGVRADEAAPGSGLGLAIVRDLAEIYGASIALDASRLGGLQATLSCPAAPAQNSNHEAE